MYKAVSGIFSIVFLLLFLCPSLQTSALAVSGGGNLGQIGEQKTVRSALVIGNAAYKTAPLKNAVNDAMDIAKALEKSGFLVNLLTNSNQREMEDAIRNFGKGLRTGGVGLFYFAGHGIQYQNRNYLIPVDAQIDDEADVKYETVDASLVLSKMEVAKNDLNIVILDACRNNPFSRSFRSTAKGLSQMDAPTGSLIAYATSPGSVAADGRGRNGIYTKHLLHYMEESGLTINQMFMKVRRAVLEETGEKQTPWESSSLTGNFYFRTKYSAERGAVDNAPQPNKNALQNDFKKEIPAFLQLDTIEIEGTENVGNTISLKWKSSFKAILIPKAPLYIFDRKIRKVTFVTLKNPQSTRVEVYGTIYSTKHQGKWKHSFDIDNGDFDTLGKPIESFNGKKVLIVGSKKEDAFNIIEGQYSASIQIPEMKSANFVYLKESKTKLNLGFTIRCNQFYHNNGENFANITISEKGHKIFDRDVGPWTPLVYKKFTIYLATYTGLDGFSIQLKNQKTDTSISRIISFQKQFFWEEEGVTYGVVNAENTGNVTTKVKIYFTDKTDKRTLFWMPLAQDLFAQQEVGNYIVKVKQPYSIGLVFAFDE